MRTITSVLAAGLLACSMSAIAANDGSNVSNVEGRNSEIATDNTGNVVRDGTRVAEYGNECAWGLANGKHIQTTCSVNLTGEDGKTYCFANDKAMAAFMKEPAKNMSKAKETYGRS